MDEIKVIQQAGSLKCDFEGARAMLQGTLDEYKGIVFTEDSKKEAKSIVAGLRKNKKAFQDRIKEVKSEYMKPYDDFYKQAVELVNMFDEPIDFINEQVRAFEEKRIAEKKELIQSYYDSQIATHECAKYIPLNKIYNPKWENATVKESAIVSEMVELVAKTNADLVAIKAFNSDVEESALKLYAETLDAIACVNFINRHEQEKAAILERERERVKREEEERIRREERERVWAERVAEVEKEAAVEEAKQSALDAYIPEESGEPIREYTYQIKCTNSALRTLEMYMDSVGIGYKMYDPIDIMDEDLPI